MKVLAVIEDGELASELEDHGVEVLRAGSLEEAVEAFAGEPSFAIVDERIDFADEVVIAIRCELDGPDRDRLPVIAIAAPDAATGRVRCTPDLRVERADAAELVQAAKAILLRRARQRRLFDQEVVLDVPTAQENTERAGEIFDRLVEVAGYDEEQQVRLGHTFREAVGNAAEHGNKNDASKSIRIHYWRSSDRVGFAVGDEGDGFDSGGFLARADEVSALEHTRSRRESEARPGGLGVFIMKETCDAIRFNGAGNAIFLMKYLPGCEPQA